MSQNKPNEYEAFIKLIEESGVVSHWAQIAEALGVSQNTISIWKKRPEAQEAIAKGIANALQQMETAGKKDWRMWEAKLKMLGLNPSINIKHGASDPVTAILQGMGLMGNENAGETPETEETTPQSST